MSIDFWFGVIAGLASGLFIVCFLVRQLYRWMDDTQ